VIARNGGVEVSSVPPLRLHTIECLASELDSILSNYQSDPQVERAEVNKKRKVEESLQIPSIGASGSAENRMGDGIWLHCASGHGNGRGSRYRGGCFTPLISVAEFIPGTSIIDQSDGMTDPMAMVPGWQA